MHEGPDGCIALTLRILAASASWGCFGTNTYPNPEYLFLFAGLEMACQWLILSRAAHVRNWFNRLVVGGQLTMGGRPIKKIGAVDVIEITSKLTDQTWSWPLKMERYVQRGVDAWPLETRKICEEGCRIRSHIFFGVSAMIFQSLLAQRNCDKQTPTPTFFFLFLKLPKSKFHYSMYRTDSLRETTTSLHCASDVCNDREADGWRLNSGETR
jgi:hypothetical protein